MDLRRLCCYYMNDALAELTPMDIQQLESHHEKFYTWMKLQVQLASEDKLARDGSQWIHASPEDKTVLIDRAHAASVNGEMVNRLGPKIAALLRQEVTPLELMLEGKLLYRFYGEALKWDRSNEQMGQLIKHFAHHNPRAKILEIGGGTGGTTTHILNALGKDDSGIGPLAASYDFTDISSGFFEAAKEKFGAWRNLVRYNKLDIEEDPMDQGFEGGVYDLVVASQCLHATKNMEDTMRNVRKLLRPGGKLFVIETTNDELDVQFAFGLLPGWWLSEEEGRKFSPSLSIDMWDRVLHRTGFNGVETEVHDCESEELYSFSVITSTATGKAPNFDPDIVLVTGTPAPPDLWLDKLQRSTAEITGHVPTIEPLHSIKGEAKVHVFLGDIDKSALRSPDLAQFEGIKALCTKSKGLLWISRGGAIECENVDASLNVGFVRSLRMEYSGKPLATLDLDPRQETWSMDSIPTIAEVFKQVFDGSQAVAQDFEYADRDGTIFTPRYYKDVQRNRELFSDTSIAPLPKMAPFYQEDRPLRMCVGTPGHLDTLSFEDDPTITPELNNDTVEVIPRAYGVNFLDIMVAMGQLNRSILGCECSGIVTRVGSGAAAHGFKIGDRVAMFLTGHYGSRVRAPWMWAVHIPDDMSFETAATLPVSYATAYISIFDTARLQKGDKILIHAASGAFGQAAIALAKHVDAEIFATVGTEAKRDFLVTTYGIPANHIFSSRDSSFAAGVLSMTQGRGVDVVLNSLAGALLQESFNCLAPLSRFIEIGKRDLEGNSHLAMGNFLQGVSFSCVDLVTISQLRGHETHRVLKAVVELFEAKVIGTLMPVTVYPLSEVEKAFRLMQAGKHMGKLVISIKPDDQVPVLPRIPSAKLRPDSSYLVVGGLGGIGQSICHWMAKHGAKNIVVLSRSANAEEKTVSFLAEMAKVGCKVKAVGCDISGKTELANVLRTCAPEMPPIRGVIQAAMVLQDSILEQMTVEDYHAAIRPKVHGSWNLHSYFLHTSLDFFIMLSSLTGIVGNASQSNYAAGNTYQDALALHRNTLNLPGTSIDLGVVKSVGYVAETDGLLDRMVKSGYMVLSEDDVLRTIESAILSPSSGQLMLGLQTGPGQHWDESQMARDLRFAPLTYRQCTQDNGNRSKVGTTTDLGGKIAAAMSLEEAVQVMIDGIKRKMMDIFMIDEKEVVPEKPLVSYGLDSLVAVELRNMLALRAGADVSIFDIMQSADIGALARVVARKSSFVDSSLLR